MSWRSYGGEHEGRSPSVRVTAPQVTMGKSGQLRLNAALARLLPNMRECELLYDLDSDPQKMALKLLRPGDTAKFTRKLGETSASQGPGFTMSLKRFWTLTLGFDLEETRRYPAFYDESKRMVIITLEPMKR